MVLVLSGHVFNPKRGVHGLVRETLSTVGGCASILKAGRPRKSGGRTTSARAGTSCISCFKFQRQISATCERNEPQCWLFILRCNTSWIVRISCTPHGEHTMTAAHLKTRSPRSLAHQ